MFVDAHIKLLELGTLLDIFKVLCMCFRYIILFCILKQEENNKREREREIETLNRNGPTSNGNL